jgi:hypothetical protein
MEEEELIVDENLDEELDEDVELPAERVSSVFCFGFGPS